LSFKPDSGRTKSGAETLVSFNAFASSLSNLSFINFIAISVSNKLSVDLYSINLENGFIRKMHEICSNDVESYHSYSSNGRWVIFSSRRYDGNFTRPFIAYIDEDGIGRRPFELPQENPNFHREFMKSYNIPEFMSGPVKISPHEFSTLIKNSENIQATQRN
jgi:hypothetical protein